MIALRTPFPAYFPNLVVINHSLIHQFFPDILKILKKILDTTIKSPDSRLKKLALRCIEEFENDFLKLIVVIHE